MAPLPPMLLNPSEVSLKDWYRDLGLGLWNNVLDTSPIELLLRTVAEPANAIPWARLAGVALIAQMRGAVQPDASTWQQEAGAVVPMPMSCIPLMPNWLRAKRTIEHPAGLTLWITVSLAAAQDLSLVNDLRAVVWLDDAPERHDSAEYREAWRGLLFTFLLLRALPQVLFLTRRGSSSADGFAKLALLRSVAPSTIDPRWSSLDVGTEFSQLIERLSETAVPLPEVGVDLPNQRNLSSGIEGELVWEAHRIAVVRSLQDGDQEKVATGWHLWSFEEFQSDIASLVIALKGAVEGETA